MLDRGVTSTHVYALHLLCMVLEEREDDDDQIDAISINGQVGQTEFCALSSSWSSFSIILSRTISMVKRINFSGILWIGFGCFKTRN